MEKIEIGKIDTLSSDLESKLLAMIYLSKCDLSKSSPVEIVRLYDSAKNDIENELKVIRNEKISERYSR